MSQSVAEASGFEEIQTNPIGAECIWTEDVIAVQKYRPETGTEIGEIITGTVVGVPEKFVDAQGVRRLAGGILLAHEASPVTRVLPPSRFFDSTYTNYGAQVSPVEYRFGLVSRPGYDIPLL